MSPFLKVMQLFLMMSATVLGMLVLLLFIPDLEESILEAMHRYQFTNPRPPPPPSPSHHQEHASISKNANTPEDGRSEFLSGSKMGYLMAVEIDRKKKKFTPWPSSEECRQYYIQFARQKSLPMTALVSFPGSGNTWVRYLIETTTGIFTGSVYADKLIFSKGFFGERESPDCGCTSVQKTHGFALAGAVPKLPTEKTAEVSLFNGRAILLLRNPYEALLSYRNYLYGGHTGFAPNNKFRGRDWEHFVSRLTIVWRELAATWINHTENDAIILHFEHLKVDPTKHVRKILEFLKIAIHEHRLSCVLRHRDGPFRRPRSAQETFFKSRDPFSRKHHQLLDTVIEEVNEMLKERGWNEMPFHLYKYYKGTSKKPDDT
nr:PREDICTED: WSC domain-containing protein 1-like [Bemisia tabaci]